MTLKEWQERVYETAKQKGWHEDDSKLSIDMILVRHLALFHSEVSEALEEIREQDFFSIRFAEDGKPEGFIVEMGDIIIRVLDTVEYLQRAYGGDPEDLNIERAMELKDNYNRYVRKWKHAMEHGEKRF